MRAWVLGVLVLVVGCGEDGDDGGAVDAAAPVDAFVEEPDAAADGGALDGGPEPDAFVPSCEPGGLEPGDVELSLEHEGLTRTGHPLYRRRQRPSLARRARVLLGDRRDRAHVGLPLALHALKGRG